MTCSKGPPGTYLSQFAWNVSALPVTKLKMITAHAIRPRTNPIPMIRTTVRVGKNSVHSVSRTPAVPNTTMPAWL